MQCCSAASSVLLIAPVNWLSAARVMFCPPPSPARCRLFAVFRHHGDAVGNGLLAVRDAHRLAINKDLPLPAPRPDAEQALYRLGTSGADQPGDAEDFSATQGK